MTEAKDARVRWKPTRDEQISIAAMLNAHAHNPQGDNNG